MDNFKSMSLNELKEYVDGKYGEQYRYEAEVEFLKKLRERRKDTSKKEPFQFTPAVERLVIFEKLERLIDQYFDGDVVGSTSENLTIAFALQKWDDEELTGVWINDPYHAWFHRLDDIQREFVTLYRGDKE